MWKAWSSRLVTATLVNGPGVSDRTHVLSCYAPTFATSREVKIEFFDMLQQALSGIPSREPFLVLGDFNARVGSHVTGGEWWSVRGPHGHGELNEAGKELLTFLSINGATVCNTWFQKRVIHMTTWQHSKSKKWHCIDFAIVRQSHRRRCIDVSVMRGAECNTDHQLLRVKMVVGARRVFQRPWGGRSVKRYDVVRVAGARYK